MCEPRRIKSERAAKEVGLRVLERDPRPCQMSGRPGHPRRAQTFVGEPRGARPHPHSGKPLIGVAGIFDPMPTRGAKAGPQPAPRNRQQRPQNADADEFAQRRHSGEPVGPTASGKAQQKGFGLILQMMCEEEMQHAVAVAPVAHQPEPRLPRHCLQVSASGRTGPV